MNFKEQSLADLDSISWQKLKKYHVEKGLPVGSFDSEMYRSIKTACLKDTLDQMIDTSYHFVASGRFVGLALLASVVFNDPSYGLIGTGMSVMSAGFPVVINFLNVNQS